MVFFFLYSTSRQQDKLARNSLAAPQAELCSCMGLYLGRCPATRPGIFLFSHSEM